MYDFSKLSDEEIKFKLGACQLGIGPDMYLALEELRRRQSAKVQVEISTVGKEVSQVRADISRIQSELKTLKKSHRVHLWILFVAIVTALLALIAALDVVLKWIPDKKPVGPSELVQPKPPDSTNR
jgi:hypothetical protein